MREEIVRMLKEGTEQQQVVGPIVEYLLDLGWNIRQIIFGKNEWKVPQTPSDASRREAGKSFSYFPVDIAVFETPETTGDYRHLLFIVECKQPKIEEGLQQLEAYMGLEPHVRLGIWANNADKTAEALFVYKGSKGLEYPKHMLVGDIPSQGSPISPEKVKYTFADLKVPSKDVLYSIFSDLLNVVVAHDANVTRREEQLDQLCNLVLLKLDSDKHGKLASNTEVYFRTFATPSATAAYIKDRFRSFIEVYPDVFTTDSDREILFDDVTIHRIVDRVSKFNFIDVGADTVSIAFQVLRSAALKQEEGQYFTPKQVIQAAVQLMNISVDDIIIDPACGTGGFLIQCLLKKKKRYSESNEEVSRWAQLHIYGIDKDAIGIKLTKAIMQILGDGSAHCVRGDSVLTHTWESKYPHLLSNSFKNDRFTKVLTNPPFGAPLKISFTEAKKSGLSITRYIDNGKDVELGLAMFNRCCDLLKPGGTMCIVLPETYFFSPSYAYVRKWVHDHLKPICVANVPMEAFQGFCRAKTNLYVFEKLDKTKSNLHLDTDTVTILTSKTCGIYKNGSDKYIVDKEGRRTDKIDNELWDQCSSYSRGEKRLFNNVSLKSVYEKDILVPSYYDISLDQPFNNMMIQEGFGSITLGELSKSGIISIFSGHGSPSNDVRNGTIPYVKVSDIRDMRVNVNPTNLIPIELARKYWKTKDGKSNLKAWDLLSPSRASSNIGEFSILVPGEEQIVLTKEVLVIRADETNCDGYSPFYLLWALSLKSVRLQWKRITLMQTNREDIGHRYMEIRIPKPKSKDWADSVSAPFRKYFHSIADAKTNFIAVTSRDGYEYIASVGKTSS